MMSREGHSISPFIFRKILEAYGIFSEDIDTKHLPLPVSYLKATYVDPLIAFINPTDGSLVIPEAEFSEAISLLKDMGSYCKRAHCYGDAFDIWYRAQDKKQLPDVLYALALLMYELASNEDYVSIYLPDQAHDRLLLAYHWSRDPKTEQIKALHREVVAAYKNLAVTNSALIPLEKLPKDFESTPLSSHSNYSTFQIFMQNVTKMWRFFFADFFSKEKIDIDTSESAIDLEHLVIKDEIDLKQLAMMHQFLLDRYPNYTLVLKHVEKYMKDRMSALLQTEGCGLIFFRLIDFGLLRPSQCAGYYDEVKRQIIKYIEKLPRSEQFLVCNNILMKTSPLFELFVLQDPVRNPFALMTGCRLSPRTIEEYLGRLFEKATTKRV